MVEKEIKQLIQNRIKNLKLINTGDLLNSIKVTIINGQINISALEYFKYLDKRYNIMDYVFKSSEFKRIYAGFIKTTIINQLKDL